ncbi:MAG: hypothetical protein JXR39_11420 [Marinilabiliaceae bacterium]|nr:hypothetical protein [Marinilabiliaceae bacterium]
MQNTNLTSSVPDIRPRKTIRHGSFIFHIVQVERPSHYPAAFMNRPDWALQRIERTEKPIKLSVK